MVNTCSQQRFNLVAYGRTNEQKKDRKDSEKKGHGLNPSQRDESSQKVDLASQGPQTNENNQSMNIGDESTAASDDESAKQTVGTLIRLEVTPSLRNPYT